MKAPSTKTLALLARVVIGLALLVGAGLFMQYLIQTKPTVSKSELEDQAVRVRVMRVEPIEVARQWRGYGMAQAKDTADVPARVGAAVAGIPEGIEVGRVVTAGQVIARLDPTDFQNTFNAAEKRIAEADALVAQLDSEERRLTERLSLEEQDAELARADYQRQVERLEESSATQTDVDRSQRALINAERALLATRQQLDAIPPRRAGLEATQAAAAADRDTAKANLERATIKSPIAGVIESLDIEVGENLMPGARVARIVDPRVLEVPLQLPASARSYVTQGNTVTLTTRSQPDGCPPWQAKVTRIGVVDGPTRTFTVFAEIDQKHVPLRSFAEGGGPYKLPVGAFTLARLDTAEPASRIILPARAIQEGRVRTIIDGSVVSKQTETAFDIEGLFPRFGIEDDQWVVLKQPLDPGELVVLSASMSILDGQRVEPIVTNDLAKPSPPDEAQTARNGGAPQAADEAGP